MLLVFIKKRFWGLSGFTAVAAFAQGRTESAFVRAARAGDKDAFQALMSLSEKPLRQFASRRVPKTDLDDVLQETWVSIWQSLARFEGETRFREWAYSICFRKVQDYWRRERVRSGNNHVELLDGQAAYFPKEFEQVELRDSFEAFWRSCPEEQREVLAMYYGDGFTLKEIGEVLGRNLNTVKYQFYRAHEQAAEQLPHFDVQSRRGSR